MWYEVKGAVDGGQFSVLVLRTQDRAFAERVAYAADETGDLDDGSIRLIAMRLAEA